MEQPTYRIVFRGELTGTLEPEEVKRRLAALLKLDADGVERLFSGASMTRHNLSHDQAMRYQQAFQSAGARLLVEPDQPTTSEGTYQAAAQPPPASQDAGRPAAPPPPAPPHNPPAAPGEGMTCPKCGFEQPRSEECVRCGVLVGKATPVPRPPAAPPPQLGPPVAAPGIAHSAGTAARLVKPPAIALMVFAGLNLMQGLLFLLVSVLGMTGLDFMATGRPEDLTLTTNVGLFMSLLIIVGFIVVLGGALKMLKLQSWGASLAAAIVAMIPGFSCYCYPLGLGFGIWALVMLVRPDVKESFT